MVVVVLYYEVEGLIEDVWGDVVVEFWVFEGCYDEIYFDVVCVCSFVVEVCDEVCFQMF